MSGIVETMDDGQINEITSVSGSGPAYVYSLILAMINGAVAQGISRETATEFVIQTVRGLSRLLKKAARTLNSPLKNMFPKRHDT